MSDNLKRFEMRSTVRRATRKMLPLVAILLLACGGTGFEDELTLPPDDFPASTESGVDMSGYESVQSAYPGWSVTILTTDGATLDIPNDALPAGTQVGIRAGATAPTLDAGVVAVSDWFEVGVSRVGLTTTNDRLFTIAVPIECPVEAVGHPGLQLWLTLDDGVQVPVHGYLDQATGKFLAVLQALPAHFRFGVAFNDRVVRLDGSEVPDPDATAAATNRVLRAWGSTDWAIDYDAGLINAEQAKKVLAAARKASGAYSRAGFNDPILVRSDSGQGMRWHLHVVKDGSHFSGVSRATEKNEIQLLGDLYIDSRCVDVAEGTGKGLLAQTAHELFHAVFWGYRIPRAVFTYSVDGSRYSYLSTSGFNEGFATAIGNFIDLGTPDPRSFTPPGKLYVPVGIFDENDRALAYRNQDFIVFLLRVGSLTNVRIMLESLAGASQTVVSAGSRYQILKEYSAALEKGGLGLAGGTGAVMYNEILAEYMANRAYIRSYEGWIWPGEPTGGEPGEQYVLDRSLFGASVHNVTFDKCLLETRKATCTVEFPIRPAQGALFEVQLDELQRDFRFKPASVTAAATSADGGLHYWVFGESDGHGEAGWFARGHDGGQAAIQFTPDQFSDILMILTSGTASGKGTAQFIFEGADEGLGPECQELAACCPNLPGEAVIAQCWDYIEAADETNCAVAGASLLRLCR